MRIRHFNYGLDYGLGFHWAAIVGLCPSLSFQRRLLPSTGANYPASSVLRASPPPHTARPVPRGLPVPKTRSPLGLPVLRLVPFACMPSSSIPRQVRRSLFTRTAPCLQPSPKCRRVGSCITLSSPAQRVHSRYGLHARRVARKTLYTEGSDGFIASTAAPNCYRVERTSSLMGIAPAVDERLFTAHCVIRASIAVHMSALAVPLIRLTAELR